MKGRQHVSLEADAKGKVGELVDHDLTLGEAIAILAWGYLKHRATKGHGVIGAHGAVVVGGA